MLLDLYDEIFELYKWSLSGFVPLSLFAEVADLYDDVRSYVDFYVRSGIRSSLI